MSDRAPDETAAELAAVIDRAMRTFGADGRVRAVFLAGSRATGRADRYSDLDLLVAVAEQSFDAFCDEWQTWIGELAATVATEQRSFDEGFLVNAIMPSCARFDVLVRPVAAVAARPARDKPLALFDLDGLEHRLPEASAPFAVEHDPAWLSDLVYAFIRTLSLLPMLVARGEFVRLTQHVHLLKQDLLELLLFENGDPPLRRPGAWAWVDLADRLPATDLALVQGLPALAATRESVIDGHLALAAHFVPRARGAVNRVSQPWPSEFERAVRAFLYRELNATFGDSA